MLGPHAEELVRTPGRNPERKPRPFSVSLRAFLVARSRYAEDLLAHAAERGVTQYVLLGAGLDTFAHRNPYPSLRVFEVDHPATQQWKRELLLSSGLPAPANLTYAPVDFERQPLAEQLHAAGFDATLPSFFAWLGVVPYLTLDSFRATLRFISAQPTRSGVVFDYGQPRAVLTPHEQLAHDSLASRVQLAGEAFQLFFTPAEITAELAAFRDLEDIGSTGINARYFAGRSDGLKVMGSAGRLVSAWL
jgi:methyltransferase (TIGR00027 family)